MRVRDFYFHTGFVLLCAAAMYPPAITFLPRLDGWHWPVVRYPAVLSTVLEETSYSTRIAGHTYRIRDCDFRQLKWYFGTRESRRASGVQVEFLEPAQSRPQGRMDFGPWVIQVSVGQLTQNSYADAYHQCYLYRKTIGTDKKGDPIYGWPVIPYPWLTPSKFY